MQEQRLTNRLLEYWDLLRKGKPLPDIHTLNAMAIDDIWEHCFLVSVDKKLPPSFTYEYMGQGLATIYGRDLTGLTVDPKAAHFPGSVLHRRLENVVHARQPMQDSGHMINYDGKMVRYRACLMPFGNEKEGLTHIVAGLSCRFFQ